MFRDDDGDCDSPKLKDPPAKLDGDGGGGEKVVGSLKFRLLRASEYLDNGDVKLGFLLSYAGGVKTNGVGGGGGN